LTEKCENSIELMETRLKALSPKVGAVLFQLPPQFSKNRDRLASFLQMLLRRYRYAFEFRHTSWYEDDIHRSSARERCGALPFRSSRCAGAVGGDGTPRIRSRPWPHGSVQESLLRQDAASLGARDREMEAAAAHRIRLLRQRSKSAAPLDARRLIEMLR
jgi:hypothetical protein